MRPIIESGGHNNAAGGCVMEWVSLLHAGHATVVDGLPALGDAGWGEVNDEKTDSPECTNRVVTWVAQRVNDRLGDGERDEFGRRFLARILRARRLPDPETERRVNVRLAIWAARQVSHLWPPELREACEEALAAADGTLTGAVTREEAGQAADRLYEARGRYLDAAYATAAAAAATAAATAAAAYATATTAAAAATDAATDATTTAATAATAATDAATDAATTAATAADALVDLFDGLLDAHQKAVAEEGAWGDLIELWEEDACAFADEFAEPPR